MIRRLIPFLLVTTGALAQSTQLTAQFRLIKTLLPESTRCGFIYNPDNFDPQVELTKMTRDTGIKVFQTPAKSVREISSAVRNLAKQEVNFIYLLEDRVITKNSAVRFVVRPNFRKKVPVFSTAGDSLKVGLFGHLFQEGTQWRLRVNGNVISRFDIEIPPGNPNIFLEELGVPE